MDEQSSQRINSVIQQLMSLIDPNCKHCYGRGNEGINIHTKQAIICTCVKKKVAKLGFRSLDEYMKSLNQESVKEARDVVNQAGEIGTIA